MKGKGILTDVFAISNRMTAKQIYVPEKLRPFVTTVETSSGTRLK
jgi:hypothetical protein